MNRLLEKLLEVIPFPTVQDLETISQGFITSKGKIIDVRSHRLYAEIHFKGKKKTWMDPVVAYMMQTGDIRFSMLAEEVDFTIAAPVSTLQLSAMSKMARQKPTLTYEIIDDDGGVIEHGNGVNKMIRAIKRGLSA